MQTRLLAFFLPVFLLATVVLGGLVGAESARRISLEAERERPGEALYLAREIRTAINDDREAEIGRILSDASSADRVVYATLDDTPIPSTRAPSRAEIELRGAALDEGTIVWPWSDGDFLAEVAEPTSRGRLVVLYRDSTNPIKADISRYWTTLAMILITTMVLVAAGLYPLTRWALWPIRDLDSTATALAEGDMSARATVHPGAPEIRQLADSFNAMAEQVEAGLHRERAFVASASHHFGNLLTPLRLRVESIDGADPMVHEALAELDRLEMVAERLLELNHAEEESDRAVMLDVGAVVDETLRSWRAVTDKAGIELKRTGAESVIAWAVPGSVDEALDNLIDNSIKYADSTPIAVRVIQGLHNVRITVTDGGPGMSADEIEHAEGRFWRGATQQSKPGSGLGLAIVDALVTRSGGHFEMRNAVRGGLESAVVLKRATNAPVDGASV